MPCPPPMQAEPIPYFKFLRLKIKNRILNTYHIICIHILSSQQINHKIKN